jgi:hypothetical protein
MRRGGIGPGIADGSLSDMVNLARAKDALRSVQGAPPIGLSEPTLSPAGSEPEPLHEDSSEAVQ